MLITVHQLEATDGNRAVCRWLVGTFLAATLVSHTIAAEPVPGGAPAEGIVQRQSATPRLSLDKRVYDFGVMAVGESKSHIFRIENSGNVPLTLAKISTSCKCAVTHLGQEAIPPGGVGEVKLQWVATDLSEQFSQSAKIKTNDPQLEILELRIVGQVLAEFAATPPELFFGRVRPHQTGIASTVITSQRWDEFDVTEIESSLVGLTWELTPATPAELAHLKSRSGWRLTAQLPPAVREGDFQHWFRFRAVRAASSEDSSGMESASEEAAPVLSRLFEIPVTGRVLRRLAVYGQQIDENGVIYLGQFEATRSGRLLAGRPLQRKYLVKVYDPLTELKVVEQKISPSFLDVSFERVAAAKRDNMYHLHIKVPDDAPAGLYRGDNLGTIQLKFDHPRIADLQLKVDFVVVNARKQGFGYVTRRD